MPNLTVSVDEELMAQIRAHPGINWSEAAREGIRRRLQEAHVWDELLKDSKLTEADVREIAERIDTAMADWFEDLAD